MILLLTDCIVMKTKMVLHVTFSQISPQSNKHKALLKDRTYSEMLIYTYVKHKQILSTLVNLLLTVPALLQAGHNSAFHCSLDLVRVHSYPYTFFQHQLLLPPKPFP